MNTAIAKQRLLNQCVTREGARRPADVVAWFGAMQGQEYEPAKWAVGLRMPDGALNADIESAFEHGHILRTHVMRPTWHFVTARDIRWLLELTAPRVHRAMASYNRTLELDARTLTRGTTVFERALRDGRYLTRAELGQRLLRAKLTMAGQRLAQLALHAELERVICSGPRRGKEFTYALLEERAPNALRMDRDEALAELTRRYFRSHGPATVRDFVWWSGLTTADAKQGLETSGARPAEVDGRTYWTIDANATGATRERLANLLPIYDEYLIAYRDRDAVPHGPETIPSGVSTPVHFQHALVIGGQVAGTWRVARQSRSVSIQTIVLRRLTRVEQRGVSEAINRYQRFLGVPLRFDGVAGASGQSKPVT